MPLTKSEENILTKNDVSMPLTKNDVLIPFTKSEENISTKNDVSMPLTKSEENLLKKWVNAINQKWSEENLLTKNDALNKSVNQKWCIKQKWSEKNL